MIVIDANKESTFECTIQVKGEFTTVKPRLVFPSKKGSLFLEGTYSSGKCKISIPEGLDVLSNGHVLLEVQVDNTMFSPWKSEYRMKMTEVVVESVSVTSVSPKTSHEHGIKPTVSDNNRKLVKEFVSSYKRLTKEERSLLKESFLDSYTPSSGAKRWAESIFVQPDTFIAKLCMFEIEDRIKK